MALELYLVRHGIAEDHAKDGGDAARALTDEGIEKLREIGAGLKAIEVRWDLVLTSPLVRARQTADVLLEAMGGKQPRIEVTTALIPDADVARGSQIVEHGLGVLDAIEPLTGHWDTVRDAGCEAGGGTENEAEKEGEWTRHEVRSC